MTPATGSRQPTQHPGRQPRQLTPPRGFRGIAQIVLTEEETVAYLKAVEVDELTLPSSDSDHTYTVKMKRRASFGDQRAAQSAMIKVNGQTGIASDPEWSAYIGALMPRLIVEWNLTDENGTTLPINLASIDLLDAEDGRFLQQEAIKRTSAGGGVAQSGPFVTPSATD